MTPGFFTTLAIDNIDHNPSSNTSIDSFHGTSISVFQHSTDEDFHQNLKLRYTSGSDEKKKLPAPKLPAAYTSVFPTPALKPEAPIIPKAQKPVQLKSVNGSPSTFLQDNWLESQSKITRNPDEETCPKKLSFAAYFSENPIISNEVKVYRNELLPLLNENVDSHAMVRHCMLYAQRLTEHLNNDQHVVLVGDQRLFQGEANSMALQRRFQKRFLASRRTSH